MITQNSSLVLRRSTTPTQGQADGHAEATSSHAPRLIRDHFAGTINLDEELTSRYPGMPVMSSIHFRPSGSAATLSTQDGAAILTMLADESAVELVYVLSSMLGLRFRLDELTTPDRTFWLDQLRSGDGPLTFLWGARRWDADYLIWVPHRYFVNLYAFSPRQTEAAVRLTSDVAQKLLDWLEKAW